MGLKKGIISIFTIVVVLLGIFMAVRFVGGRENVSKAALPSDSTSKIDNVIINDNNTNTQVKSTNEMDAAYINDKTNVGIYTVKANDTVFSIVKTHMPSHNQSQVVEYVKNRNDINTTYKIAVGQKIVIPYEKTIQTSATVNAKVSTPTSKATTDKYSVKKEDTLYSIAKSKMTTHNVKQAIKMLKESNNITNENNIKYGMLINIPK